MIMEDKKINEKESLELITQMILQTKRRFETSDGNMLLSWGILTVAVAAIVMVTLMVVKDPSCQTLWALMALGSFFFRKKEKADKAKAHRTYIDTISNNIWKFAAGMIWPVVIICVVLEYFVRPCVGYHNVNSPWLLLYVFALIVMGGALAMQGIVIKVKSLVVGGFIGVSAGMIVVGLALCQVPVTVYWGYPLLMVCFMLMMVVPGIIMRNQARNDR